LLVICELLIFYEATKGLLVGMGDPPSTIYPDGYGSGEIPPPATRYGDTRGVILLSWGLVWGVHTRWGFTHCHLESDYPHSGCPHRGTVNETEQHRVPI
jgi:hypothetical protein